MSHEIIPAQLGWWMLEPMPSKDATTQGEYEPTLIKNKVIAWIIYDYDTVMPVTVEGEASPGDDWALKDPDGIIKIRANDKQFSGEAELVPYWNEQAVAAKTTKRKGGKK